ncbi:YitT family protein [Absicoccus porci]|jgi:uncharacterized membrane protein YczE|uniref:YitT family protein n=1 Tax=Absicoccus porci TaxID=2486576 RepID=A0A3N0HZZ3_9FIRM|nr:DUF6198 family protein [Absicoccus porci]MDD6459149.1 DUF6198 family protein [Absicoccus porci]MEE1355087.1 DUF6198 family protein [Absicoccus porci]RNM30218.1 hypothetical protein EDX97_05305 [Absicoccus porci]
MTKRRWIYYLIGLFILALGLELNSKTGLGVSAIISVAYANSVLFGIAFPDMTLILYIIFVLVELIIHTIRKQPRQVLVMDVLQIPLSIVFTRFMKVYELFIPDLFGSVFSLRLFVLILAVICTGIGAAMTLNMRIVPNPGDGIVQTIADAIGKETGITKNCVDLSCVLLTLLIDSIFVGSFAGLGLGTLLSMIGVGRTIAYFNRWVGNQMVIQCGIDNA